VELRHGWYAVLLPEAVLVAVLAGAALGLLAGCIFTPLALVEPELGTHEGLSETRRLPERCQCEVQ